MTLRVKLTELANRAPTLKESLHTEASTCTALVMPFLSALGYDVFNPTEVVPEFTADIGTKKGEKVDYAIMRDGEPQILIEVKCWNVDLKEAQFSQLLRYYATTPARIGILTNGLEYRFYADLVTPNKMDPTPFLVFSLEKITPKVLDSLQAFTRDEFRVDDVLDTASGLRSLNGIRNVLMEEFESPSDDLVRLLTKELMEGRRYTQPVLDEFRDLVTQAFAQFINERVQQRLSAALSKESDREQREREEEKKSVLPEGVVFMDGDIITTEEEVEAFERVQTLVGEVIDPQRVFMRDAKSYCSVLVDDNNRKAICRFYLDRATKYVEIFDENKVGHRYEIESVYDLTKLGKEFRESARRFVIQATDAPKASAAEG